MVLTEKENGANIKDVAAREKNAEDKRWRGIEAVITRRS